jgi:hypothetical protein
MIVINVHFVLSQYQALAHPISTALPTAVTRTTGFRTVVSSPWYLDNLSDYRDWARYLTDEIANFTDNTRPELVIGGEACMWGEWVDAANVVARYMCKVGWGLVLEKVA